MTADDHLRFYGMRSTIELAPIHYAIDVLDAAENEVGHGGIPNLFSTDPAQRADLAGHAETQVLRNSLAHPDVRILLTITQGHYRLVGRRSSGIAQLADLAGKRVATMNGTSAAFYLRHLLETADMDESDITIVSVPRPHDISRQILDGEVDALLIWEPEAQIAVDGLGTDAIVIDPDLPYSELYNLHTTQAHLDDPATRARIVDFVADVLVAQDAVRSAPDRAVELLAEATGYPADLIRRTWEHHTFPATLAPELLDTLVKEEAWLAAQDNRPARSRAELARLIDPSVLEDARAKFANR